MRRYVCMCVCGRAQVMERVSLLSNAGAYLINMAAIPCGGDDLSNQYV